MSASSGCDCGSNHTPVATPTAKAAPEPETTGQHVQRWLRSVAEYWRLSVICSFERIRPVKAPSSESPNTKESSA